MRLVFRPLLNSKKRNKERKPRNFTVWRKLQFSDLWRKRWQKRFRAPQSEEFYQILVLFLSQSIGIGRKRRAQYYIDDKPTRDELKTKVGEVLKMCKALSKDGKNPEAISVSQQFLAV
ncbi:hypothetical protein RB195_011852 [Necator americanus]|uniref:Uncharacterized protein n=1 Tax=Necator americanus TaxID=51031 RepID=A0ABR1D495_NECAM